MNGEVLIVDEHTGRILAGRRYNEGMHQAIEAKEGVEIKDENQTLATITLQNYFRLYDKLSGMTGTAMTEAAEFDQIYKLGVVPIPTNQPMVRVGPARPRLHDRGGEVRRRRRRHRRAPREGPAGPGRHRRASRSPSTCPQLLRKRGIPHEVLNAKHHEREAQIVAQAGRKGAVTVATNMAGRGTDIMLGGNPEFLADRRAARSAASTRSRRPRSTRPRGRRPWRRPPRPSPPSTRRSSALGGLYVLGTERHESRRIDNQLRGRSGRQGDPGESRFYLSLQDDLMRLFKARRGRRVPDPAQHPRRRADRGEDGHPRHRARADPGRGAELRDPQERPQVRRGDEPAAQGHLRRAPPRARGRGPARAGPPHDRRHRRRPTSTARPPRATPRTGTSTSCGRALQARSTRSASPSSSSRRSRAAAAPG